MRGPVKCGPRGPLTYPHQVHSSSAVLGAGQPGAASLDGAAGSEEALGAGPPPLQARPNSEPECEKSKVGSCPPPGHYFLEVETEAQGKQRGLLEVICKQNQLV